MRESSGFDAVLESKRTDADKYVRNTFLAEAMRAAVENPEESKRLLRALSIIRNADPTIESASLPCHFGVCRDGVGSYACECVEGYDGSACNQTRTYCAPDSCQRGGECVDFIGEFQCRCPAGWGGGDCSEQVDYCKEVPDVCGDFEGAVCASSFQGYSCVVGGLSADTNSDVNQARRMLLQSGGEQRAYTTTTTRAGDTEGQVVFTGTVVTSVIAGGAWFGNTTWTNGTEPNELTFVVVEGTVTIDSNVTVAQLLIMPAAQLVFTNNATITVTGGMTVKGAVVIRPNSTVDFVIGRNVKVDGGVLTGRNLTLGGDIDVQGVYTVANTALLGEDARALTGLPISGTVELLNTVSLTGNGRFLGPLKPNDHPIVMVDGGTLTLSGDLYTSYLTVQGDVLLNAPGRMVVAPLQADTITVAQGTTVSLNSTAVNAATATRSSDGGSSEFRSVGPSSEDSLYTSFLSAELDLSDLLLNGTMLSVESRSAHTFPAWQPSSGAPHSPYFACDVLTNNGEVLGDAASTLLVQTHRHTHLHKYYHHYHHHHHHRHHHY
jgi:hypothetical protein